MTKKKSIESNDLNLGQVFNDFYNVPDYQREYVWGADPKSQHEDDQVYRFLNDVYSEIDAEKPENRSDYFIGSFIVCEASNGGFDLIDGQQRLTTSFLVFCAIRDALEISEEPTPDGEDKVPGDLKNLIFAADTDDLGRSRKRAKLVLQYEDAKGILDLIVDSKIPDTIPNSKSATNIMLAYDKITQFIKEKCGDDRAKIKAFFGYFKNRVMIICVKTSNLQKALEIFETINDRGVGLDAMDLLKNLMFIKTNALGSEQFDKLKVKWKDLTDTIHRTREKPMRFLRYFVLSDYASDNRLRENEIYNWFQKSNKLTQLNQKPIDLVDKLLLASKSYEYFRQGKDPTGNICKTVQNLNIFSGSSMRQHYILLLAGRHFTGEIFVKYAGLVERLMFTWYMVDAVTRDTEPEVVKLSKKLRDVENSDEAFSEFEQYVQKEYIDKHAKAFAENMMELEQEDIPKYRMKYILAKLTQFIEQEAKGETESNKVLYNFTSRDFEIEHILAQGAKPEAVKEFKTGALLDDVVEYIPMLGNLLLIDKSRNIIASNDPYSKKIPAYNETDVVLSQYIARNPPIGKNDRITRAHNSYLKVFEKWNPKQMQQRQKMLTKIAHSVWGIPQPDKIPQWDWEEDA